MMLVFAIGYIVFKIIQERFEIEKIKKNNRLF